MALDLFAGIPVTDYDAALPWYEQFFGRQPSFLPNSIEAVWEVAEHRYVYIVEDPERAGNALVLLFSTISALESPRSLGGASSPRSVRHTKVV